MKSTYFFLFLFVLILGGSLLIPSRLYKKEVYPRALLEDPDYLNTELPIETRIDDLLSYMTVEEKVGQMTLVEKKSVAESDDIATYGIGALLSGAGANPENNSPEGWKNMVGNYIDSSKKKSSRYSDPVRRGRRARSRKCPWRDGVSAFHRVGRHTQ